MSKVLKLKRWLTLTETANRLSTVLEDEVSVADVLRFALDGHIKLSVNLTNSIDVKPAYQYCPVVYFDEFEQLFKTPKNTSKEKYKSAVARYLDYVQDIILDGRVSSIIPSGENITTECNILSANGIFDLPMLGAEKLDVTQALNDEIGGPLVTDVIIHGPVLQKNGNLYQIQNRYRNDDDGVLSYYPADRLPEGSTLIIRTDALREFELNLVEPEPHVEGDNYSIQEKPLATKERNTLLTIIATLCDYSAIDHQGRGVAGQIASLTDEIGAPVTDDTIRKVLAQIPDALQTRMK